MKTSSAPNRMITDFSGQDSLPQKMVGLIKSRSSASRSGTADKSPMRQPASLPLASQPPLHLTASCQHRAKQCKRASHNNTALAQNPRSQCRYTCHGLSPSSLCFNAGKSCSLPCIVRAGQSSGTQAGKGRAGDLQRRRRQLLQQAGPGWMLGGPCGQPWVQPPVGSRATWGSAALSSHWSW